jgi:predicted ATPase
VNQGIDTEATGGARVPKLITTTVYDVSTRDEAGDLNWDLRRELNYHTGSYVEKTIQTINGVEHPAFRGIDENGRDFIMRDDTFRFTYQSNYFYQFDGVISQSTKILRARLYLSLNLLK